jgi:hypothetical protein
MLLGFGNCIFDGKRGFPANVKTILVNGNADYLFSLSFIYALYDGLGQRMAFRFYISSGTDSTGMPAFTPSARTVGRRTVSFACSFS